MDHGAYFRIFTGRIFKFYDHGAYFEFVTPVPAFGTGRIFVLYDHGAYFSFVITFAGPYLRSSALSYGPRGVFSYFRTTGCIFIFYEHGAYFAFVITFARRTCV